MAGLSKPGPGQVVTNIVKTANKGVRLGKGTAVAYGPNGPTLVQSPFAAGVRGAVSYGPDGKPLKIGPSAKALGASVPSSPPPAAGSGGSSSSTGPKPFVGPGPDQSYLDSTYNTTVSGIQGTLADTRLALENAGIDLGKSYGVGFKGGVESGLQPGSLTIDDASNPFSRAALLKQAYQQSARGDGNRMAAQGQLYSGAYQNAQNADTSNFNQGENALLSDFASRYGGLVSQGLAARQTASQQTLDAQVAAQQRNAQTTPTPPPSVPNFPSAPGPGKTAGSSGTGFQDFSQSQAKQAGITGAIRDGKLVFLDSKGNVIPGAVGYVQGNKSGVRVPRGA